MICPGVITVRPAAADASICVGSISRSLVAATSSASGMRPAARSSAPVGA
jgi:hypothetical protein